MGHVLLDSVTEYVDRHALLEEGDRVLVGVSGGVDSMVCLTVLRQLGYEVHALHVNYGLREGAEADETLVRQWCAEQEPPVSLHVEALDAEARADREGESLQEAARILRYEALAEHAETVGAERVAVGHHRDDQAETLLLNLFRGAGPEGLAGMPPARSLRAAPSVQLIRPLLGVSRAEIVRFANAEGVPWREDPTNRDSDYARAVVRNEVLPLLQEKFGGVSENIARAAGLMREYVDHTLTPALQERLERGYEACEKGGALSLASLRGEPSVWQRRLILAALRRVLPEAPQTAPVAAEVESLIETQVGRRVEVGRGTVWREREVLRFLPNEAAPDSSWGPVSVSRKEEVSVPPGTLRIDLLDTMPESLDSGTPAVEYVDADRLVPPLLLRPWQEGDRLQPLGLDGTKLVADILTEDEVPPHQRKARCVLCSGPRVVWVVGHRLDRRVRIRASTTQVARLTWRPREKASDDCISA